VHWIHTVIKVRCEYLREWISWEWRSASLLSVLLKSWTDMHICLFETQLFWVVTKLDSNKACQTKQHPILRQIISVNLMLNQYNSSYKPLSELSDYLYETSPTNDTPKGISMIGIKSLVTFTLRPFYQRNWRLKMSRSFLNNCMDSGTLWNHNSAMMVTIYSISTRSYYLFKIFISSFHCRTIRNRWRSDS
jgi:hypothetical protein